MLTQSIASFNYNPDPTNPKVISSYLPGYITKQFPSMVKILRWDLDDVKLVNPDNFEFQPQKRNYFHNQLETALSVCIVQYAIQKVDPFVLIMIRDKVIGKQSVYDYIALDDGSKHFQQSIKFLTQMIRKVSALRKPSYTEYLQFPKSGSKWSPLYAAIEESQLPQTMINLLTSLHGSRSYSDDQACHLLYNWLQVWIEVINKAEEVGKQYKTTRNYVFKDEDHEQSPYLVFLDSDQLEVLFDYRDRLYIKNLQILVSSPVSSVTLFDMLKVIVTELEYKNFEDFVADLELDELNWFLNVNQLRQIMTPLKQFFGFPLTIQEQESLVKVQIKNDLPDQNDSSNKISKASPEMEQSIQPEKISNPPILRTNPSDIIEESSDSVRMEEQQINNESTNRDDQHLLKSFQEIESSGIQLSFLQTPQEKMNYQQQFQVVQVVSVVPEMSNQNDRNQDHKVEQKQSQKRSEKKVEQKVDQRVQELKVEQKVDQRVQELKVDQKVDQRVQELKVEQKVDSRVQELKVEQKAEVKVKQKVVPDVLVPEEPDMSSEDEIEIVIL